VTRELQRVDGVAAVRVRRLDGARYLDEVEAAAAGAHAVVLPAGSTREVVQRLRVR